MAKFKYKEYGRLGNNNIQNKIREFYEKDKEEEDTYFYGSGMQIKHMEQLIEKIKNKNNNNNIKLIFLDFDQNITVHNGLFDESYYEDLKLKLSENYTNLRPRKKMLEIRKEYSIYWLGSQERLNTFIKLLKFLKKKNIDVYIITANSSEYVTKFLKRIGLINYFKSIISSNEKRKEKYQIIKKIWNKYNKSF